MKKILCILAALVAGLALLMLAEEESTGSARKYVETEDFPL